MTPTPKNLPPNGAPGGSPVLPHQLSPRLIAVCIVAALTFTSLSHADPTTQTHDLLAGIPLGAETTIITGPKNPDGTINYVAAADRLGASTKPDDNAAKIILRILPRGKAPFDILPKVYTELGEPVPTSETAGFVPFTTWLSAHPIEKATADDNTWLNRIMASENKPWARRDNPEIATWLDDERKYFELLQMAAERSGYYEPLISNANPPTMLSILTSHLQIQVSSLSPAFASRIYSEMGERDFTTAATDLAILAKLGIVLSKSQSDMQNLGGVMAYVRAMRGYRYLALQSALDGPALKALADNLPPPYTSDNSGIFDKYFALDAVMQAIRGDAQSFLRVQAMTFNETTTIDEGNLRDADWETVLRAVVSHLKELDAALSLPRAERYKAMAQISASDKRDGLPTSFLISMKFDPDKAKAALEAFLKRRDGETGDAYSRRMAKLFIGDAQSNLRGANLFTRPTAERALTEAAIALARYRGETGQWPESLASLTPAYLAAVPLDPFADGPLRYRHEGTGFVLYSVGLDELDNGGEPLGKTGASDMVVTPQKPVDY